MSNTVYLNVPGLGNSGPEHWQTYFEKTKKNYFRVTQSEWENPVCSQWIAALDKSVSNFKLHDTILIGHSLGCITIAHWAKLRGAQVKGALLVAPSDIETNKQNFPGLGFDPIPLESLNFKTIVVASNNDPWISLTRAQYFAKQWGSEFVNIGNAGHINTVSGYGNWPEGIEILKRLD